jgi:hypothetical protein
MQPLTLTNNAADLIHHFHRMLALQRWSPGQAGHGAYISPALDLPDAAAGGTPNMLATFLLLWATQHKCEIGAQPMLREQIERMEAATDFMLQAQRPSGCIDFLTCNIDSAPDTAFSVTPIALGYSHLAAAGFPPELETLRVKLAEFLRKAARGLIDGGVHTPNHRWVVTAALVLLQKLFPEVDARPTVEAYLAETIDINEEGFFIERSAAVYDAVCNRSLFLIEAHFDFPAAREAALRNLRLNLNMLSADGTIETGLSHRQDFGVRSVPSSLASCYLRAFALTGEVPFLAAAQSIYAGTQAAPPQPQAAVPSVWLAHEFLLGVAEPTRAVVENEHLLTGTLHLAEAGYWGVGSETFTASSFRGRSHLLAFRTGQAELASLQIAQTYLGQGQFIGNKMQAEAGGLSLRYDGIRPGWPAPSYRKPLGRAVPMEQWDAVSSQRDTVPMTPAGGELKIRIEAQGLALEYLPDPILSGVPGQIALDFAPDGIWEGDGMRLKPQPGQVLFLTKGFGRMSYGTDTIEVGPGHYAHGTWAMRDAQGPAGCVRVLITLLSPQSHAFFIRTGQRSTGRSS